LGKFDAKHPSIRQQLVVQLGLADSAIVEDMPGFQGGLNEGIWNLRDSKSGASQELVLKLVKCQRIATNVPTEAENFAKLRTQHPQLATDPVVAFPLKIFRCTCGGEKRHDLIVMQKVKGERLSEFVAWKNVKKQTPLLLKVFEKIGKVLAEFHARYGNMQHGDFQPSNIFYDETGDSLVFIDLGGMGVQCMDNDVQHFTSALSRMSGTYSPNLISGAMQAFDRGYKNPSASSPVAASLVHSPMAVGMVAGGARLVSIAQSASQAVQAPRFFHR
jgi:Ser/Thr protein kinase RdoA (MazF antagonist)